MAKSMNGQLPMFDPMTSTGSRSATSLLASVDGPTPSGSQGGRTNDMSGQEVVRVSRSRLLREDDILRRIRGSLFGSSSLNVALTRSLVSRLSGNGGLIDACATWKVWTTRSGQRF